MRNLAVEKVARAALNKILATSISERSEYGGMIYFQDGKYHANDPQTQGYGNTVNVGQYEKNCGCPENSKPVAYYHTHPNYSAGGIAMQYNEYSDEDKNLARDLKLDAYLGTLDGSFFLYDPATDKTTKLPGVLHNVSKK